jgi:hypothetical protein
MALMWYVMNWMRGGQQAQSGAPGMSNPLYRKGDLVDMYVYLSEEPYLYNRDKGELIWKEMELGLATSPERQLNYTYHPSQASGSHTKLWSSSTCVLVHGIDKVRTCSILCQNRWAC